MRLVYADWLQEQADAVGTPGYFDNWFGRFVRAAVLTDEYPRDGIWGSRLFGSDLYAALEPFVWTLDGRGTVYHTKGSSAQKPSKTVLHVTRGFVSAIELPCAAFLAHAEAIFAAHPVTAVRLTDRRLYENDAVHSSDFFEHPDEDFGNIPKRLFRLWKVLPKAARRWTQIDREWMYFPDQEAADVTLSALCVAHGRRLAKLPPLPAEAAA